MPVDEPSSAAPSRAAEFRSGGIKIGAALVVFIGLYALYSHEVKVEMQVDLLLGGPKIAGGQRAGGAKGDLNKDTPAALLAAESGLKKALDLQPSNPYALAAFADTEAMLVQLGYADRADPSDSTLARIETKDIALPERYEARALRQIELGKPGEAETGLLAVLARFGNVPRAIDALGQAQRAQGKLVEARMSFKRAQDADWRSPRKVANFATALLEDGNALDALAAFDRALQANSDHLRSMIGKARAFAALARAGKNADLKAAQSLVDQVLSRGSDEVPQTMRGQALAASAEVKLAAGDAVGAAAAAAKAKESAPADPQVLRALALTATSGQAELWKAAVAKDPYDAALYFDGAKALADAGDGAGAEKLLEQYGSVLPKTARYHLAVAHLLLARVDPKPKLVDTKAADAELALALKLEPANAMVYFEMGRSAQLKHDTKTATTDYERAAQLRDDFPEVYRQMGLLYFENKALKEGLVAFTDALQRYKAMRTPEPIMESFYAQVQQVVTKAGKPKIAVQWVKEARGAH